MTLEVLRAIALFVMAHLGQSEGLPVSVPLADAIAAAVYNDDEGRLTGSPLGDVVLATDWAFHESRWGWHWTGRDLVHVDCPEGDGGAAHGYFQLQARPELACPVEIAAPTWLHWAHGSQHRCRGLPLEERLAKVASGTCDYGHVVARFRWRQAAKIAAFIKPLPLEEGDLAGSESFE